ncbi:hypothetical protein BDZ89DRAFT_1059765 [Hymenopellis radicata]|nr:hypothetical protein BDZ89DRAFT_1059765 [Hymenopellis radicata]
MIRTPHTDQRGRYTILKARQSSESYSIVTIVSGVKLVSFLACVTRFYSRKREREASTSTITPKDSPRSPDTPQRAGQLDVSESNDSMSPCLQLMFAPSRTPTLVPVLL